MGWATDRNRSQSTADLASCGRSATQAAGDRAPLSSGEPSGNPLRMPFPCNVPQANASEQGNRSRSNCQTETGRAPLTWKEHGPHQDVFPLSRARFEAIVGPHLSGHSGEAVTHPARALRPARALGPCYSAGTTGEHGSDPGSGCGSSIARSAAAKSSNQSRPMQ